MKYRIREEEINGIRFFYPEYKKFLFWNAVKYSLRGKWFPCVCTSMNQAKESIEEHKEFLYNEYIERYKKPIYHYVD